MQEKGQRMSDQTRAFILKIIDNWQGTLVTILCINMVAPTCLVIWMLAQQGGYVNSSIAEALEAIVQKVSGNQVLTAGLYYQDHAECLQNAVKEAKEPGWYLTRLEQACRDADERATRHMETLGVRLVPSIRNQ